MRERERETILGIEIFYQGVKLKLTLFDDIINGDFLTC